MAPPLGLKGGRGPRGGSGRGVGFGVAGAPVPGVFVCSIEMVNIQNRSASKKRKELLYYLLVRGCHDFRPPLSEFNERRKAFNEDKLPALSVFVKWIRLILR